MKQILIILVCLIYCIAPDLLPGPIDDIIVCIIGAKFLEA